MKYNFDELTDRRNTDSYKWDSSSDPDILPMWVADMDFRTAPAITEALRKRVDQGIFGYTRVPESYYAALDSWFSRRHSWSIDPSSVIYTSGVVPAISAIIKALTRPGDRVIVQTPVYNCFFSSIRNNGCMIDESLLIPEGDTYLMDFDDLERRTADPRAKVLLLCNPHNPVGRVWTKEELKRVGEICFRNGVTVISDEIHCELTMPGYEYVPFASLGEEFERNSVICVSPSKAFNIAGLQIANIICRDDGMRARIDRAINDNEVCDVNPFGVIALQAAYNDGADWLDQLRQYIFGNYKFMYAFCAEHLPEFPLTKLEGTYLVWMDCKMLRLPSDELEHELLHEAGLWLNAGTMYGDGGEGFMRWNIACPRSRVEEGLKRFKEFVDNSLG